eukprot:scaffold80958_cov24-Tisochrysis_lutea.AAC.4
MGGFHRVRSGVSIAAPAARPRNLMQRSFSTRFSSCRASSTDERNLDEAPGLAPAVEGSVAAVATTAAAAACPRERGASCALYSRAMYTPWCRRSLA